jgi:periplasmic divalent cation tolerance protein
VTDYLQVTAAVGSREEAGRIATALVERRLAACVQIVGPVRSVYRWQGKVEQADEWLCQAKTTRDRFDAVEAAIHELHSYECPEIIATPIVAGSAAYLQWLGEQVAETPGANQQNQSHKSLP